MGVGNFFGIYDQGSADAYSSWQQDKARRDMGFVPQTLSQSGGKQVGASMQEAGNQIQYTKPVSVPKTMGGTWTKDTLALIPKQLGKNNTEKFNAIMDSLGASEQDRNGFRTWLANQKNLESTREDKGLDTSIARSAKYWQDPKNNNTNTIVPNEPRTLFNRIVSPLMTGNYLSAGVADALVKGQGWNGVKSNVGNALRASAPWGEGNPNGEFTYSKVLNDMGVNPASYNPNAKWWEEGSNFDRGLSNASISALGLTGDVALDPSTWVSGGFNELLKGAGLASKAITSSKYLNKIAELHGISEPVSNAKDLIGKVFDTHVQDAIANGANSVDAKIAGQRAVQSVDDMLNFKKGTMNPVIAQNIVRNLSKGQNLSEEQIAQHADDFLRTFNKSRGVNRVANDVEVGLKHSPLGAFTRALGGGAFDGTKVGGALTKVGNASVAIPGSGKVLQAIGDKTLGKVYNPIRNTMMGSHLARLFSTKAGLYSFAKNDPQNFFRAIQFADKTAGSSLDKVTADRMVHDFAKNELNIDPHTTNQIIKAMEDKSLRTKIVRTMSTLKMDQTQGIQDTLKQQQMDAQMKLNDLDYQKQQLEYARESARQGIDGSKEALQQAEEEYARNLSSLKDAHFASSDDANRALDMIQQHANDLEKRANNVSSPLKPELHDVPAEPSKPTRPSFKNPESPVMEGVPTKPDYPVEPKMGDFVDKDTTQLQYEGSGVLDKWKESSKDGHPNQHDITHSADEFSKLIYGETGHISPAVYPSALDNLADLIHEGRNVNYIKDYIDARKHFYDGRAKDIYGHVADAFGYGGQNKYKTWDEFYTKRKEEIEKKATSENRYPNASENKVLAHLEDTRLKRAQLITKLKDMNKLELKKYLTNVENTKTWNVLRHDENAKSAFGDTEEARRQSFQAEDRASEAKRTGQFDDKQAFVQKLTSDDIDHIHGSVLNDIQYGKGSGVADTKITLAHRQYANDVLFETDTTMKNFFPNRNFSDLSDAQKRFVIGVSKQNTLNRTMGTKIKGEAVTKTPEEVKKALKDEVKQRQLVAHSESVKASTKIGTRVTLEDGTEGRVVGVNHDMDGNVQYNVKYEDGSVKKGVSPTSVYAIKGEKPVDTILHNTMEGRIQKKYDDAMKAHQDEIARIDAEHEQNVKNVETNNAQVLADHQAKVDELTKQKELAESQYQDDMKNYESQLTERDRIQAINDASLKDWENAVRTSSNVADEYFQRSDELKQSFHDVLDSIVDKTSEFHKNMNSLTDDMDRFRNDTLNALKEHEIKLDDVETYQTEQLYKEMNSHEINRAQFTIYKLQDTLNSEDGFASFLELHYPDQLKKWDASNQNSAFVGKTVLDSRTDLSDKVKTLIKNLHTYMARIGEQEVSIGKLTQGQLDANMDAYLTHVLTDSGEQFASKNQLRFSSDGTVKSVPRVKGDGSEFITNDYGFGQTYNPYGQERKITKVWTRDGKLIENPNIIQINDAVRHLLNGQDLFKENIADIFTARMLKHNELMYDHAYTSSMMNEIGKDLPDGVHTAEKGSDVVMNFGQFKESLANLAHLNTILEMGTRGGEELSQDEMKQLFDSFHDQAFEKLGMTRDGFQKTGTPMVKLDADQVQALHDFHNSTIADFQKKIDELQSSHDAFNPIKPNQELLDRISGYRDKLASIEKPQIKQVDKYFVNQANNARMMSLGKDMHGLLAMYDKFLHWTKLMQTTVMPNFHFRNFNSNNYQNWLAVGNDSFDWEMNKAVFNTLHSPEDTDKLRSLPPVLTKNGETIHWDEMYDLAKANDAVDEGFFAKDIGANAGSNGLIKPLQNLGKDGKLSLDPTDTNNFIWFKKGTQIGSRVENQARLLQFASHIKNGLSPKEATEIVNKYLFDYGDVTSFERNVMKRIFPFYTWLRKNGQLQLTNWMENPTKYALVQKLLNGANNAVDERDRVQRQYLAPFARDWVQTPFSIKVSKSTGFGKNSHTTSSTNPVLWNPNLPFMDLSRIPDPTHITESLKNAVSMMSVPLKSAIELGTNKDFFFDQPIVDGKADTASNAGALANYLANNVSPYSAVSGQVTKTGVNAGLNALNTFTGNKFLAYDYDRNKQQVISQYLGKMKNPNNQPIDHFLNGMQSKEDALHSFLPGKVHDIQMDVSRITNDYLMGKDLTKETAGKYYPFVQLMKAVGMNPNSDASRKWVMTTLDDMSNHNYNDIGDDPTNPLPQPGDDQQMSLSKMLLGNDFTMGKLTDYADGDSMFVEVHGKKIEVRINMIDTPETVKQSETNTEPYGHEASDFVKNNLKLGQDVRLVLSKDKDRYGRYVAYLMYDGKDGQQHDLGLDQLQQGQAKTQYWNLSENKLYSDQYKEAQNKASADKTGLWSIPGYAKNDTSSFWDLQNGGAMDYMKENSPQWADYRNFKQAQDAQDYSAQLDAQNQASADKQALYDANHAKLPRKARTSTAKSTKSSSKRAPKVSTRIVKIGKK